MEVIVSQMYSFWTERLRMDVLWYQELPESLGERHFARFDIYAPFVQRVVINSDSIISRGEHRRPLHSALVTQSEQVRPDWQSLFEYADTRVLPPNLTEILCRDPERDQTCANWLRVILSPSVRIIDIEAYIKPLSLLSEIVSVVASKSARLDKLAISPRGFTTECIREDTDPHTHTLSTAT
jgi:hypothetical protein